MKILYVEDDVTLLSVVIPEIFWSFMTEEEKMKFKAIRKDEYDGSPELKDLFADNPFINVEFDFLSALKRIESQDMEQYDYFILDRNLDAKGISIEDVKQVFPKFTKSEFNYIWNDNKYGREGDFLLRRLYSKLREKISRKVYFISSYPSEDVFQNDEFLRDIVDNKILTRENYIAKDDNKMINESGKQRLRDILESDDEEFQLYRKWGKVLSYYDHFKGGYNVRKKIVLALKGDSVLSSKKIPPEQARVYYYDFLISFNKYYSWFFKKRIKAQLDELNTYKREHGDSIEVVNRFYSNPVKIPSNIVMLSNTIRLNRNHGEHEDDMDSNVDLSCLSVLVSAYALLELTRFWQEKEWFDSTHSFRNKLQNSKGE